MDSLVANLSTTLKEGNNYTDDDIAFAIYKNQLAGWGYTNSPQVDIIAQVWLIFQNDKGNILIWQVRLWHWHGLKCFEIPANIFLAFFSGWMALESKWLFGSAHFWSRRISLTWWPEERSGIWSTDLSKGRGCPWWVLGWSDERPKLAKYVVET